MCGHAGYAFTRSASGRAVDDAVLRAMGDSIAHRGPDDGVVWASDERSVGAVFRRLSIIDLEGGRQPLPNETGDVIGLVNGEIYNFKELRFELEEAGHRFRTGSDAEVAVHLYEEHGDAFPERLVGMFAFAIIDLRGAAPRVLIGRDRLGIKPMYYVHDGEGLAWGSEPKALLAMGDAGTPRGLSSTEDGGPSTQRGEPFGDDGDGRVDAEEILS